MRLWPVLLLVLLGACALPREEGGMVEPTMEPTFEPVMEAPVICVPGDDDGIGGTGCTVE